jgi:excisionase family DNA binding protein
MPDITPLTVSIADCTVLLGIGRSTAYRLIDSGDLQIVKAGRRTLVTMDSILAFAQAGAPRAP